MSGGERRPGSRGEHELQDLFGTSQRAKAFYDKQMLSHLNGDMIDYLARQDLMVIATSDANGECDCSLRAGEPGFVRALDAKTVVYPELRGNGVLASLGNMRENPHVALAFFDFCGSTVGLHINGRATLAERSPFPNGEDNERHYGTRVERWVIVDIVEAYIHCSKHIPLMKKLDKNLDWGTDDIARKGGDFFHAKREPRPWVAESSEPLAPPAAAVARNPRASLLAEASQAPQTRAANGSSVPRPSCRPPQRRPAT